MKQGLNLFSVHANIQYRTADGWEGSRAGMIPTFAVIGGTVADAEANAANLLGMPVGTVYTLPGEAPRTITVATFTAYPMDAGTVIGLTDGWPRTTADGRTVWACCVSAVGPECEHVSAPTD